MYIVFAVHVSNSKHHSLLANGCMATCSLPLILPFVISETFFVLFTKESSTSKLLMKSVKLLVVVVILVIILLVYLILKSYDISLASRVGDRGSRVIIGGDYNTRKSDMVGEEVELKESDMTKFIQLMNSWPTDKPKGTIYILANANQFNRPRMLVQSLLKLQEYFLKEFLYPVVIFHEENFRGEVSMVRRGSRIEHIYFMEVTFSIPSFLTKPVPEFAPCTGRHPIGYRHMCRFHAKMAYEESVFNYVDYALRLDDDSFITGHIHVDLFQQFQDGGYTYGYVFTSLSHEPCTVGLRTAADNYIRDNKITPTFLNDLPLEFIFYNNFEMSKVSFWKSEEYQKYIDYIDQLGGIYYHRWGDAPVKTLAVAILVPKDQIHHFTDVPYKHYKFKTEVATKNK